MPYRIRISQIGGTTNRTLQYMLALALRAGLGTAEIYGAQIPEWGIETRPVPSGRQGFSVAVNGHVFPMPLVLWLATEVRDFDIDINYVASRMAYFRSHLDLYRSALRPRCAYRDGFDERHLVMHIRAGDVLEGRHPNYFPLPISWYRQLVQTSGLRPVFVGQFGDAVYAPALRAVFPDAEFVSHDDAMADFHILRTSVHVVPAISTFSWLAAWLSDRARTIALPVAGILHPGARPQIDLLPIGDDRYRFHLSSRHRWGGGAEELAQLIGGDHGFAEASHDEIDRRFAGLVRTFGYDRPAQEP